MTPQDKISIVLSGLKDKSEISPNSKIVEFRFNFNFLALGILMAKDEVNILLKLEKEGILKFHFPKINTWTGVSASNGEITKKDALLQLGEINIELLDGFNAYYNKHCKKRLSFWLLESKTWPLPSPIYEIRIFCIWVRKYWKWTVPTIAMIGGLLIYDYSRAFGNIKILYNYLVSLFIK